MFKFLARKITTLSAARTALGIAKAVSYGAFAVVGLSFVSLVIVHLGSAALSSSMDDPDAFTATLFARSRWLIATGLGFAVALRLDQVRRIFQQRVHDLSAQGVHDGLLEGAPAGDEDFILYLRPFDSTGQVTTTVARGNSKKTVELEAQLAVAAKQVAPFIGLGESLEHLGAGRIAVSDSAWRDSIQAMLPRAKLIVVIPVTNPGTLWEVERILERGLAAKTLFVNVPGTQASNVGPRDFDQRTGWPAIQALFARRDFVLPEFNEAGAIYLFGPPGLPILYEELRFEDEKHLEALLRRAEKLVDRARYEASRLRPATPERANVAVEDTADGTVVTVPGDNRVARILAGAMAGVVLLFFLGFLASVALTVGGYGVVFFALTIGLALVAMIYVALVHLLNTTTFTVDAAHLVVRHASLLPWPRPSPPRLARGDVEQLFVLGKRQGFRVPQGLQTELQARVAKQTGAPVKYDLKAKLRNGQDVLLCAGLGRAEARFIEHTLEDRLGLVDRPVPGEYLG